VFPGRSKQTWFCIVAVLVMSLDFLRAHLGARGELTHRGRPPEGEFRGNFYPSNFLGGKPPLLGAVWGKGEKSRG
jgi:hypothetical protein